MSADPDFDPFADEAQTESSAEPADSKEETKVAEVEEVDGAQNGISVTFKAHGGFDAPWVVARGSADYLAGLFGVKDFDGRISTLMKQVAKVDEFYKKQIGGDSGKG